MKIEIPNNLFLLMQFLCKNCGFILTEQSISSSFEDVIVVLQTNQIQIRFVRDRGNWFIEINGEEQTNEWYDISILKEYLTKKNDDSTLVLDEQIKFLKDNLNEIKQIFSNQNISASRVFLDQCRKERAKRLFPKWYNP